METHQGSNYDPTILAIERVIETMDGVPGPPPSGANTPEVSRRPVDLDVPPDIQELLGSKRIDAGMPANQTKLYRIDGHPGLLARCNDQVKREELVLAYGDARDMGLPMLPAKFVKYKEVAFAVTAVVDGLTLEEALAHDPPAELLEACRHTWAKMSESLANARENATYWAVDVQDLKQFMWGTIPGDTQARLWMVDLPTNSYPLEDPSVYGMTLLHWISSMFDVEDALGTELTLARQHYARAIAACPDSVHYGDGFRNAADHCLANRMRVDDMGSDEFVFANSLRTH